MRPPEYRIRGTGRVLLALLWSVFLCIIIVFPNGASGAQGYEPDELKLTAEQALSPSMMPYLSGPFHTVDETIVNIGTVNYFTVSSQFGSFTADGNHGLKKLVHELEAIDNLKKMSNTKAFGKAVVEAGTAPVETAVKVVADPVGTVTSLPGGLRRLFKKTIRETQQDVETVQEGAALAGEYASRSFSSEGGGEKAGDTSGELVELGKKEGTKYVNRKLGYNDAERLLARDLKIDPYTENPVLREALASKAWAAAPGTFASRYVNKVLPKELGYLQQVSDLVWNMNTIELQIHNEEALEKLGVEKSAFAPFFKNPHFSPTLQTRIVSALGTLEGVSGLDGFLHLSAEAISPDEAFYFVRVAELLSLLNEKKYPLVAILEIGSIPLAEAIDDRIAIPVPVDYLPWSREIAEAVEELTGQLSDGKKRAYQDLWVEGLVSERAAASLSSLNWNVNDRAFEKLTVPNPAE